ncbi:universal stress protein [Mycolicibacterium confluentis]|uniref:Universal stress protein n=1 Tax=Mycolicibacterium confluentis TaxID=28047 RepID=A0A7I7XWI7_9MYCO|nr:universal stress protein [Mycolicibacterium confluentis]MCV7321585.1 universal stress protein [Mycolicibacterium confluentis]ORV26707.1 hypothetical protein AWB99_20990 [Mycolicibacterium confluentis]BBZ33393.1 universal stress protein [Mycolicibacterium confluentis]
MEGSEQFGAVVVGIDGSDAAIGAARWAAHEASIRGVPLRLVHATDAPCEPGGLDMGVEYGEQSLRSASAAVNALNFDVALETALVSGDPSTVLIDASRDADLICLGSVGIGRLAATLLGSTAEEVARKAHCPVAILRRGGRRGGPADRASVVVPVTAAQEDKLVIDTAMQIARHTGSPVLAVGVWRKDLGELFYDELDERVTGWRQRCPDVTIRAVSGRATIAEFLADYTEPIQLVVIGEADVDQVLGIVGPHSHALIDHGECSVLVARR